MALPLIALLALGIGGEAVVRRGRRPGGFLEDVLGESAETQALRQKQMAFDSIQLELGPALTEFDFVEQRQMQNQLEIGKRLAFSDDPQQQQLGTSIIQSILKANLAATGRNEAEFNAGLTAGDERLQASTSRLRLRLQKTVIDPLNEAEFNHTKVVNLLDNNDRFSTNAALITVIQALDDSVVREAERLVYLGTNGFINELVDRINEFEGQDFIGEFRQDILNMSAAALNANRSSLTQQALQIERAGTQVGVDTRGLFVELPDSIRGGIQIAPTGPFIPEQPEGLIRLDETDIGPAAQEKGLLDDIFTFDIRRTEGPATQEAISAAELQRARTDVLAEDPDAFIDPATGIIWRRGADGILRPDPADNLAGKVFTQGIKRLFTGAPADLARLLRR